MHISFFPQGEAAIMAEVYARGPVACVVDANPLRDYNGGIVNSPGSTQVLYHSCYSTHRRKRIYT